MTSCSAVRRSKALPTTFVLTEQHESRPNYVTSSPVIMEPGRYDVEVTITGTDGAATSRHAGSITYDVVAMVQDLTVTGPSSTGTPATSRSPV